MHCSIAMKRMWHKTHSWWQFSAILLLLSSLSKQQMYRLQFTRSLTGLDEITLRCRNEENDQLLPVLNNDSTRFWINRTTGIRPGDFRLESNVGPWVIKRATNVTFFMTPDLEAYYSCGVDMSSSGGTVIESTEAIPLLCEFIVCINFVVTVKHKL